MHLRQAWHVAAWSAELGIECGYYGLQFDATGACVKNPHGDCRIPAAARVRSYPVKEAYQMIWIWMGDQARADRHRHWQFEGGGELRTRGGPSS
jgi:phenylpropionate dioxygenase-like ring-hydroxylating dioxygenase large terminal subunit